MEVLKRFFNVHGNITPGGLFVELPNISEKTKIILTHHETGWLVRHPNICFFPQKESMLLTVEDQKIFSPDERIVLKKLICFIDDIGVLTVQVNNRIDVKRLCEMYALPKPKSVRQSLRLIISRTEVTIKLCSV